MEDYENISMLKDEIGGIFEDAGFKVADQSGLPWFEVIDRRSVYVHPMFASETFPIQELIAASRKVIDGLIENDIPMKVDLVCHLPGDFSFKVYLA